MFFTFSESIWLYPAPIDFRKQIDGLIILVADQLKLDPVSGQLFLFRNRDSNKIKVLWWDRNGFWFFYKRFEQEKLIFPKVQNETIELTRDQFSWLLSGLDCSHSPKLPEIKPTNFF